MEWYNVEVLIFAKMTKALVSEIGLILSKKIIIYSVFWVLAALVILFVLCTLLPSFYNKITRSDTEVYSDKNGIDIEFPKAIIADACQKGRANCLEDVILVHGWLDQGAINSLKIIINSKVGFDTICFRSEGGYNSVALELMSLIQAEGLNTCLAEEYYIGEQGWLSGTYCKSACPLILLMGKERFLVGTEIDIGIHHSGITIDFCFYCIFIDTGGEDFSPHFIDGEHIKLFNRSRKTSLEQMDYLHQDEWKEYNIFTNQ